MADSASKMSDETMSAWVSAAPCQREWLDLDLVRRDSEVMMMMSRSGGVMWMEGMTMVRMVSFPWKSFW